MYAYRYIIMRTFIPVHLYRYIFIRIFITVYLNLYLLAGGTCNAIIIYFHLRRRQLYAKKLSNTLWNGKLWDRPSVSQSAHLRPPLNWRRICRRKRIKWATIARDYLLGPFLTHQIFLENDLNLIHYY